MERIALITGGTSGIGASTARAFIESGLRVVVTGRNEAAGKSRVAEFGADKAEFIRVDLEDLADAGSLVERVVKRFGRLDVLVNNAGVCEVGDALHTSVEIWRRHMTVNADAAFVLSRAAVARFLDQGGGGVIVNVASEYGILGAKNFVAYCASKGAMVQMTRAMALDHAKDGIRVNVVCPGGVDTPMLDSLASQRGQSADDARRTWADSSTNGRVATPEDIAHAIVFLASPNARHINGIILPVDGGSAAD
jgi:meso-butanediol dehydrogenase/(S,S)-butanediol dehydrogenase/diacetyl reductase